MPKIPGIQMLVGGTTTAIGAAGFIQFNPFAVSPYVIVGDLVLILMVHNGTGPTTPAQPGWTLGVSESNAGTLWTEVWWRRYDGTPLTFYEFTGDFANAKGSILGRRGCKRTGSPIGAISSKANGAGASLAINDGITTTARNSLLICLTGTIGAANGQSRPGQPTSQTGTSYNWTTSPIDPAVNRFNEFGISTSGSSVSLVASHIMKPEIGSTGAFNALFSAIAGVSVVTIFEVLEEASGAYDTPGTRYYTTFEQPEPFQFWPLNGTWDNTLYSPRTYDGAAAAAWGLTQYTARAGSYRIYQQTTNQDQADAVWARFVSMPLEAQTIDGTFDLCNYAFIERNDTSIGNPIPTAIYKVHIWVVTGDNTGTVRGVLLNNHLDTGNTWNPSGSNLSLAAPVALTPVDVQEGDRLVIEFGYRVTATTPYPPPTRVPTDWAIATHVFGTNSGANQGSIAIAGVPEADMINGASSFTLPWFLFSATIVEQTLAPTPPTNNDCSTAEVIGALPYDSGTLSTRGMTDPLRRLWWEFTAPETGRYIFYAVGGSMPIGMQMTQTCPPVGPSYQTGLVTSNNASGFVLSNFSVIVIDFVAGTTVLLSTRIVYNNITGLPGDGTLRLRVVKKQPLANNDVIYGSAGIIARYTSDGRLADISPDFLSSAIDGLAIDYSRLPMDDFNGGVNTTDRLYAGLFGIDIVEILNLETLNVGEAEIDYISEPLGSGVFPRLNRNMASMSIHRSTNMLTVGWFGNGFIYVADGFASYQTASSTLNQAQLNTLNSQHADDQPGYPFPQAQLDPIDMQSGGSNYVEYGQKADDQDVIYYTSGGWYRPIFPSNQILRFNVATRTQMPVWATLPDGPGPNPGLKGLFPLPDTATTPGGGMLVCSGSSVVRLDANANIVATYLPQPQTHAMSLSDVELQDDGRYFWCMDEASSSLFKFDMETGLQVLGPDNRGDLWTQLGYGSSTSIVIYRAEPFPTASPVRMTQLPLQAAYDYGLLRRALTGVALAWETPPPSRPKP